MIIGFDASRAFVGNRTGTENYSFQLLKALARFDARRAKIDRKNKYRVYINISLYATIVEQSEIWPGNFRFVSINWPRFWTQGGLALQTFKDPLDVLFVPAHTLPIIRKPGLKTVMTVHDLGVEYLPKMHQFKQELYLKNITRYQLTSATKLIAVSKATKHDLVKMMGIEPSKIAVVYEGYDKEKFQMPKSKFQKEGLVNSLRQYDLVPEGYFLFVGTVQPRKNLERLILAYHRFLSGASSINGQVYRENTASKPLNTKYQILDTKLVIAGSKGWLSDPIYQLPRKLGIEDKVKFLGYVPEKDLPALYSGARALLFPSLFEGFGLPILEAQACGCPVLTSNTSSMPEVVGHGGAILVNPYSEDDIVRGMIEISNQDTRNKLKRSGFENIKRFSWEKCAAQTLEVFEEVYSM